MLGSLPRSNLLLAILPCVVCSKVKDLEVVLQTHAEEETCPLAAFSTSKWRRLCHGRRRRQRSPLSRQSRRPAIARARLPRACRPPHAHTATTAAVASKERRASQQLPVGCAWRWANTPTTAATSRKACRPPAANIQSSAACQSTRTPFCFEDSQGDRQ